MAQLRPLLILAALALVTGCGRAILASRSDLPASVQACLAFYGSADRLVQDVGVDDAEAARVPGFPHLRTDRFLAAMGDAPLSQVQYEAWVDRLQQLDREGREVEFRNLDLATRATLAPDLDGFLARVDTCAETLRRADATDEEASSRLRDAAKVPSRYSTTKRVLGLYPVTSAFMSTGVARLHREVHEDYRRPLDALPVHGRLVRYVPREVTDLPSAGEVAGILRETMGNPLGIPEPSPADKERLFAAFAPVWEIDVAGEADRIGVPRWSAAGVSSLDLERPTVYRRISHARYAGRVLLQLNYVIWFPARPKRGDVDILAGHLDGITWRVTLWADGTPLVYDTIHNCGCYHMFFPAPRLALIPGAAQYEEALLVPQNAPDPWGGRLVLRVSSGDHYVQRVYVDRNAEGDVGYALRDYGELRSLAAGDRRRRSLFGPDGLVAGTERGERWLLWPSGVRSPGAMRQWGHHAVAFLGRRYFDEPGLIERYFRVAGQGASAWE